MAQNSFFFFNWFCYLESEIWMTFLERKIIIYFFVVFEEQNAKLLIYFNLIYFKIISFMYETMRLSLLWLCILHSILLINISFKFNSYFRLSNEPDKMKALKKVFNVNFFTRNTFSRKNWNSTSSRHIVR